MIKTLTCRDKEHCDVICAALINKHARFVRYDSRRIIVNVKYITDDIMELCNYRAIESNEHEANLFYGDDGK